MGLNGNLYLAYAETCSGYKRCLAVDLCATLFQADPFREDQEGEDVLLQEEASRTIEASPDHSAWIENCWGPDALKFMGKERIVNSEVILGNYKGFVALHDELRLELDTRTDKKCAFSRQGHINYL